MLKKLLLLFLLLANYSVYSQCYTTVVSNNGTTIARRTDGTLWIKGRNTNGFSGTGAASDPITDFTQIGSDSDWTNNISLTIQTFFGIKNNGTLWVWGFCGEGGNTGIGTFEMLGIIQPTQVGTDSDWIDVDSAGPYTFGLKNNGTLYSWGINTDGSLGIGNLANDYKVNIPTQVGTETNWAKIFTSNDRSGSYAIKTNGTLWSWGNQTANILGYPNSHLNNAYRSPHQVGTDTDWTYISSGGISGFTAGIKNNGTLFGWGTSVYSHFGNGIPLPTPFASIVPLQIGTETDWAFISVQFSSVHALKTNGTRWGWGGNFVYQLGIGTNSNILVPTQLDSDTDWLYITNNSSGAGDTVGIKQDNSLYYWGRALPPNTNDITTPTLSGTLCSLANEDYANNMFQLIAFPNPVNNIVTIQLIEKNNDNISVNVTNNLGQTVISNQKLNVDSSSQIHLDLTSLNNGLYLVSILVDEELYQQKIVKNKY